MSGNGESIVGASPRIGSGSGDEQKRLPRPASGAGYELRAPLDADPDALGGRARTARALRRVVGGLAERARQTRATAR